MTGTARVAGWTAIAGALLGIAITPFMASVWTYHPGVVWDETQLLTRAVGPTLESWGALTFGSASTSTSEGIPYEVYGKVFVFVYVLMLPIVRHVHVLQSESLPSKWEQRIWRVLFTALIVAGVGDGISYWGISAPGKVGDGLWRGGFLLEVLAMVIVLVSTTIYGIASVRLHVIPAWGALLLTAIIPIGVATLIGIADYVPNAVVVPMSIVWAMIGAWALVRHRPDHAGSSAHQSRTSER